MIRTNRRQLLAATGLLAGSLFLPSRKARAQSAAPRRLIVFFTQHGTVYDTWKMRAPGATDDTPFTLDLGGLAEGEMSEILRPLHAHRQKLLVLDGMSMASAEADTIGNGHDIGTRHALTGRFLAGTGAGGASVDQIVAPLIAVPGRINSLELSVAGAANGGAVWRGANQSIPPDGSPGSVFDRVFPPDVGTGEPTNADRVRAAQGSVLDLVRAEYEALAPRLSGADRQKVELHRDLVRDVERRLEELANVQCSRPGEPTVDDGEGFYSSRAEAMFGLTAAAIACDLTRVVTIQMGQLTNALIGAPPGDVHAEYAHLQDVDTNAHQMMTNYGRVHAEQLARLMTLFDSIPEGNGTVLDNCAVVWCSEIADGVHNYRPWPLVVGGGALCGGRYVNLPRATPNPSIATNWPNYAPVIGPPHNRFWVGVAQAVGADIDAVGETQLVTPEGETIPCTGALEELA